MFMYPLQALALGLENNHNKRKKHYTSTLFAGIIALHTRNQGFKNDNCRATSRTN